MASAVEIQWSRYIPHVPTPKQHAFLWLTCKEAFFGGAAGGGKSDALLMAALQYVDIPGYAAIIFRKTYTDLALPGAIMTRAQEWLLGTEAKWNDNDKAFTFPSGATLSFAYLQRPNDHFRYQSAEFQFIGFDEVTQLPEYQYVYLLSRLRRPADGPLSLVPLRARSAANPGGVGHRWVKERFVDGRSPDRVFISSQLDDNPHLDQATYEQSLALLDPITFAQLRHGDWTVRPPGYWIFEADHIAAARELGQLYDRYRPLPTGNVMYGGMDFGDFRTVFLPLMELERGGIYVPPREVVTSREDLESISSQIHLIMTGFKYWWKAIRYDSSFKQSARTTGKMLELKLGRHNAVHETGRPSMEPVSFKDWKDLGIKYLRLLLSNTFQAKDTRVLAISPRNKLLLDQLEGLQGKDTDPEKIEKGDDDAPDALIAGVKPLAQKHRRIIEELEAQARLATPFHPLQPSLNPDEPGYIPAEQRP